MAFMILQMVLIMNLKISTGHSRVELLASTILVLLFIYELVKIEEGSSQIQLINATELSV